MGIGALAAAATIAGTAVAAGTSIYGATQAGNAPAQAGASYNSAIKKLANQYLAPYMQGQNWDINAMMPQYINQATGYTQQMNQAAQTQLTQLLNQALPGYSGMMGQAAQNTSQLLSGALPADVVNQLQRSTAFQSMRGGFAGTGASGALTARDLGLTSLQLQGQGFQQFGNLLQMTRSYAMPQLLNPMTLVQDLLANDQWSKTQQYNATMNYFNARTQGAAAQLNAPNQSPYPAIGGAISGLTGSLTATNPQTGESAISTLLNYFSQGGGGGAYQTGSGTFDQYAASLGLGGGLGGATAANFGY